MSEPKKKEKKFNFREAHERIDKIKDRLNEMAENLESDNQREDFTDAEKQEQKQLIRELAILQAKILANTVTIEYNRREDAADVNRQIRECVEAGRRFEVRVSRALSADFGGNGSGYADPMASTNPFGLTTGDIVEPLYPRTILSAIGMPLLTGLRGNYQWPVVEAFEATVNDEGVALGDTKINVNKLIAKPERIGVAIPITREALNETDDLLQTIVTQYMPVALSSLLNKITLSTTAVTKATNLIGPFVNLTSSRKKTYSGDVPTLAELLSLKGLVLGADIIAEGLCYIMTETTKAALEATPKWDGASAAIVDDNGRINGVPVFCSSYVAEGNVLFGAFKYAPQALFGDISIIIDPYTQARKNAIDYVLNANYAITTLRNEAFAMLSKATA